MYSFVVEGKMIFSEVITVVIFTFTPLNIYQSLFDTTMNPIEMYDHRSCPSYFDYVMYNTEDSGVIYLD